VCSIASSLDWHHAIEELTAKLVVMTSRASNTERELADSRSRADVDIARLQDELIKLRDRYDRFSDISAHSHTNSWCNVLCTSNDFVILSEHYSNLNSITRCKCEVIL